MNIGQMMREMQAVQAKMADANSRLGDLEIVGQSGGGMVVVTLNGRSEMKKVVIDPKLLSADEKDMLEDLIVAAFTDAKSKVEAAVLKETESIMGGLKLPPGVKLPF